MEPTRSGRRTRCFGTDWQTQWDFSEMKTTTMLLLLLLLLFVADRFNGPDKVIGPMYLCVSVCRNNSYRTQWSLTEINCLYSSRQLLKTSHEFETVNILLFGEFCVLNWSVWPPLRALWCWWHWLPAVTEMWDEIFINFTNFFKDSFSNFYWNVKIYYTGARHSSRLRRSIGYGRWPLVPNFLTVLATHLHRRMHGARAYGLSGAL